MGSSAYDQSRAGKRLAKRNNRRPKDPASFDTVDPKLLARAIEAVASGNGAIRFGKSRDQGALSIGVYGDGDPYTEWFRDTEELSEFLEELIKQFHGIAELRE